MGGTGTLSVTDTFKDGITGTLDGWSMTVTPAPVPAGSTTSATDLALLAWFDADSSDDGEPDLLATQAADDLAMLLVD